MYPDITLLTPEKAAIYATVLLMVLAMIFGYRGKRLSIHRNAQGHHGDRPRLARHHPDRRRRRRDGRHHEHFRPCLQHDHPVAGAGRRQRVPAAAADRGAGLRARHRAADGERLHPDRDAAGAGAGQARRHADGRAHVRHVQRHSLDDHAAGRLCRLCRGQYRAHRRLDHRLDRLRGRLEHVPAAVPVRADAQPADGRQLDRDRPEFQPRHLRHLARHHGGGRLRVCAAEVDRPHDLRRDFAGGGAAAGDVSTARSGSMPRASPPRPSVLAIDWLRERALRKSGAAEAPATPY